MEVVLSLNITELPLLGALKNKSFGGQFLILGTLPNIKHRKKMTSEMVRSFFIVAAAVANNNNQQY
jgi:hypothetical protein